MEVSGEEYSDSDSMDTSSESLPDLLPPAKADPADRSRTEVIITNQVPC
jgi:hypothetical protein